MRVKGRDAAGEVFKVMTALDHISESRLYARLDRGVACGVPLSFFVSFSTLPHGASDAAPIG